MPRFLLVFIIATVCSLPLFSKGKDSVGVVKGKDFSYSLKRPAGWVLDTKSGKKEGLSVIFYPKGQTWSASPVVIYTYVQPLDTAQELFRMINDDSRRMSMSIPKLRAKHLQPATLGGRPLQVVHFLSEESRVFDAVAYMMEEQTVIRVVLSAKTMDDFKTGLPAFEESLQSYLLTAKRE